MGSRARYPHHGGDVSDRTAAQDAFDQIRLHRTSRSRCLSDHRTPRAPDATTSAAPRMVWPRGAVNRMGIATTYGQQGVGGAPDPRQQVCGVRADLHAERVEGHWSDAPATCASNAHTAYVGRNPHAMRDQPSAWSGRVLAEPGELKPITYAPILKRRPPLDDTLPGTRDPPTDLFCNIFRVTAVSGPWAESFGRRLKGVGCTHRFGQADPVFPDLWVCQECRAVLGLF